MGCLKCGRDTEEGAAFCGECLGTMRRYPVRPGTPVVLPNRENIAPKKTPKRRVQPLEEQLKGMKKRVRFYAALWLITLIAMVLLTVIGWRHFSRPSVRPGQNYTAITATTAPPVPSAETSGPQAS